MTRERVLVASLLYYISRYSRQRQIKRIQIIQHIIEKHSRKDSIGVRICYTTIDKLIECNRGVIQYGCRVLIYAEIHVYSRVGLLNCYSSKLQ